MDYKSEFISFQKSKTSKRLTNITKNSSKEVTKNKSSFSEKNKPYKLEFITQNFNDNYNDLIKSLASKAKSPKNMSKFNLQNAWNEDIPKYDSIQKKATDSETEEQLDNKKNDISNLIWKCEKKKSDEERGEIQIDILTNREEIKDFYLYTEECLKNLKNIIPPTKEQLENLYISNFGFENELKNKKLAVFDLDETLIHCETRDLSKCEIPIYVNVGNGNIVRKQKITINVRPHLINCLKRIAMNYIIIVYTASHKFYADAVLDYLDPKKEIFSYRLYRNNCVKVKMGDEEIYVKDLRIFKNIDLKKIVIIDNSVLSFAFHIDNGIPILPFYDNKNDCEMLTLVNYLNYLSKEDDVRKENRKFLKMDYFLKKANNKIEDSEYEDTPEISILNENSPVNLFILNPCENSDSSDLNISRESNYNSRFKNNLSNKFQNELKSLILKGKEDFEKKFSS